jgi:exoribonuclease R
MSVPIGFPEEVLAEAKVAAQAAVTTGLPDLTHLPFFTLDPPGSMDLDQAMYLTRERAGYRVYYAIADVPAFVRPGGAVDLEAHRRGTTIYCPDGRFPLHPAVLSEDAASLLPGQVRPAFVWNIGLDADGNQTDASIRRATVRSVARLDYATAEQAGDEAITLLRDVGELRIALQERRGGASLPMPEQQIVEVAPGTSTLAYRPSLDSEDWNEQISLLAGMAAAEMMLHAGVGILRTMPEPRESAVQRIRRQAHALGVSWAEDMSYGDMLRTLDHANPTHLALIHEAASLFRGAAYTAFDGAPPEQCDHAAVAAPYTHVTAPLRRLVDRFGLVICEAVSAGRAVPGWVRAALPTLPETMAGADRLAAAVERACIDAAEASTLSGAIGSSFDAVVVDQTDRGSVVVQLIDPAIVATVKGMADLGATVRVTVVGADVSTGKVTFALGPRAAPG